MALYFEKLIVWQKAFKLAKNVHQLLKVFPKEEQYALTDQMRRSSISVMSNIAEGSGRGTNAERDHFLHISKWSAMELASQLLLARDFWYIIDFSLYEESMWLIEEIVKIIYSLTKKS